MNSAAKTALEILRDIANETLSKDGSMTLHAIANTLEQEIADTKVKTNEKSEVQLICRVAEDTGARDAETDIATIRKGTAATPITKVVSEMYFHRLRLEAARDPEFVKRIKVLYDGQIVGLGYEDELRWPEGFLQGAWEVETEISAEREKRRLTDLKE